MGTRVRALAFPVYQKDWLYYSWKIVKSEAVPSSNTKEVGGRGFAGTLHSLRQSALTRVEKEWKGIQEAKEGTLKHILLRWDMKI
jgi:hypothetical protein